MKKKVLITCMGGYGAENLLEDITSSSVGSECEFVGTHADRFLLACSSLKINYLVPYSSNEKEYIDVTSKILKKEGIDLFVPKSDPEVLATVRNLKKIPCKTFLPEEKEIEVSQDKFNFYQTITKYGVHSAYTVTFKSEDDLDKIFNQFPNNKRLWIRVKTAGKTGGYGATWVEKASQAKMWIQLWKELRDESIHNFTLSEFLPGRLFECCLLFFNGTLMVGKVYENKEYFMADQRLSGMSSTPAIAKTADDQVAVSALEEATKAIHAISKEAGTRANGIYHLSVKLNDKDIPCVTEVNIGRFPSTCAFFNRTGKYNLAEWYVRAALFGDSGGLKEIYDLDHTETYMIRGLDKKLRLITSDQIEKASQSLN